MPTILIDSHTEMDVDTLEFMLTEAKKVQIQEFDGIKMVGKGWTDKKMDIWSGPNKDLLGEYWAPFSKHNYLYGFEQDSSIRNMYDALIGPKPDPPSLELQATIYGEMEELVGGHLTVSDYIMFIQLDGNRLALIMGAFSPGRIIGDRIYLLNYYWRLEAQKMKNFNGASKILFPVLTVTQLLALGWKRSLWVWVIGILITEGGAAQFTFPFSGWSIITFMMYGQMIDEYIEDRKLWPLRNFGLRALGIKGVSAYGMYVTMLNLIIDPAPFMQRSQKTGIHHGAHHIGLLVGALLNRWTR